MGKRDLMILGSLIQAPDPLLLWLLVCVGKLSNTLVFLYRLVEVDKGQYCG